MKEPKEVDIAGLSYLEYRLKGGWRQAHTHVEKDTWIRWDVWKEDPAELWIVAPDGVRRGFEFRLGSMIYIGQGAIRFNRDDVKEDIVVDEEEQRGKQPRPKVV